MYMAEYEIKLGIGLNDTDFNAIKNKINSLKDETIKLKLDDSAVDTQIAGIKREIESLGKTKGLKFDTSALENSLTSVKGDITEIKNLLNSLGNGANVKGLVSSINNIGTALDKVSGKFDELKADLNALSKKDFGININLDMGKNKTNPIKAMTDYGREARRNTIPQLQEQSAYLQNLLGGYQQADRALERYLVKIYKANGIKVKNNLIDDMADTSSLSKQMEAIEKYIGYMKKIASSQGVDLSGFDAQFSKAAEAIVDDTVKIQTGAKQTEESIESVGRELQKVFSSGIDGGKLSTQLDSIVTDLNEIKTTIQGLSSSVSLDGLAQSFDKLSNSVNAFIEKCSNMKIVLNDSVSGLDNPIGQGGSGIESIDNDLKQVTVTAEGTANAIKSMRDAMSSMNFNHSSINAVTKDLEEMGIEISKISVKDKGFYLDVTVKGIDSIGRAVTEVRRLDTETKQVSPVSKTFTQSFETSADIAKKEAKETEEAFNKLKSLGKEISSLDFKIAGLDADKNKAEIAELTNQLNRLEAEYNDLFNTFEKKLSPGQVDELVGDIVKGTEKLDVLKAKMADTAEAQKITDDFEKLKSLAKEISNTRIDILKADDTAEISEATAKLSRLKTEYDELLAKTRESLSNKQIGELGNIVDQGDTNAFKTFNSEVQEFIKLQNQIENKKFEIGKLELLGGKENEIADLKRQLAELEDTYNHLMNTFMKKVSGNADILQMDDFKGLENGIEKATTNAENRLKQFEAQYADAKAKLAEDIKLDIDNGKFDNEVSAILDKFSKLSNESAGLKEHIKAVEEALKRMKEAAGTGDEVADAEKLRATQSEYADAIKKVNNELRIQAREEKSVNAAKKLAQDNESLRLDMVNWLKQNTKAAKEYGDEIEKLIALCGKLDNVGVVSTRRDFNNIVKDAELHGKTGLTAWDKLVSKVKEYSVYVSAADVFMRTTQALKDMFEQVKAIDTAMTELRKVTDESDASYNAFLTNAASRAKEIGTTIDGLVTSTADFARLGYGFEDAQGLAEVANIYTVVGDEIEGVEGATQSLVSTMAAFKDEMGNMSDSEFALSIVDKFNEVSNNFSISSGGIGEALTRSASSLATANNTLDESIALITAANTVVNLCHAA